MVALELDMDDYRTKQDIAEQALQNIIMLAGIATGVGFMAALITRVMIDLDSRVCMAAIAGFLVTIVCAAVVFAVVFFRRER